MGSGTKVTMRVEGVDRTGGHGASGELEIDGAKAAVDHEGGEK